MGTIRTVNDRYLLPSKGEMNDYAKTISLKTYSEELAQDFCNIIDGGEIIDELTISDKVRENLLTESRRSSGRIKYDEKSLRDNVEKITKYNRNVCDFLKTLDYNNVIGHTPMQKALNLAKVLSNQKGGSCQQGQGGMDDLPIFNQKDGQKLAEEMNELFDNIRDLSEEDMELLGMDNILEQQGTQDAGDGTGNMLRMVKVAEELLKGKNELVSISRKLTIFSNMKIKRSKLPEPNADGREVRYRPIKSIHEMSRLAKTEWAAPKAYRLFRIVNQTANVREKIDYLEKKQLIYMIIDESGSMDCGTRRMKAAGILYNRLRAVVSGDCELYYRFFDTQLKQEFHIDTIEKAKTAVKALNRQMTGGGTSISGCSKMAATRIREIEKARPDFYKPELVVVSDGDDHISITKHDLEGIKMHAFIVDCKNDDLLDLARQTGGVGLTL